MHFALSSFDKDLGVARPTHKPKEVHGGTRSTKAPDRMHGCTRKCACVYVVAHESARNWIFAHAELVSRAARSVHATRFARARLVPSAGAHTCASMSLRTCKLGRAWTLAQHVLLVRIIACSNALRLRLRSHAEKCTCMLF